MGGNITANMDGSLTYTLALARRWSAYFRYEHVLGSPPENKWTGRFQFQAMQIQNKRLSVLRWLVDEPGSE